MGEEPLTSSSKPILFTSKNQKTGPAIAAAAEFAAATTTNLVGASFGRPQSRTATRHYPMAAAARRRQLQQQQTPQDARLEPAAAAPRPRISKQVSKARGRVLSPATLSALFGCFTLVVLVIASSLLVCCGNPVTALAEDSSAAGAATKQQLAADTKAALEAELNSILQQQELGRETNSKLLSEAIISRLMLGNLTDIGAQEEGAASQSGSLDSTTADSDNDAATEMLSAPDATRLKKMLSYLENYEMAQAGLNGGQTFSQFPVLPASQAATIKRASMKMSNYLRQQTQHQHNGQRQLNGYGRVNSFDFGLGKRPDSSVSSNILRFGDSGSAGGHMAAVSGSGLGKRPSAHRYDFGLGKRVASPAYPRYDFGLGKRAPSRIRYDFGLGK